MTFAGAPARADSLRGELIERALSLPLGDQAALARVASLCEQPTASPGGIALEASRDESFAALLLRLANSAASAASSRVADLPTAVTRLGFKRVQALALAAPGLRLLQGPADGLQEARHELHRHAIRVGLGARMLAPAHVDPERALAAGILHNLGLNVIALYAPEQLRALLAATARGDSFADAEAELLGFSHAELGADLADCWSFPADLVAAIADHDAAEPRDDLGWVVQFTDLLVRAHAIGVEPQRELPERTFPWLDLVRARENLGQLIAAQERYDAFVNEAPAAATLAP